MIIVIQNSNKNKYILLSLSCKNMGDFCLFYISLYLTNFL